MTDEARPEEPGTPTAPEAASDISVATAEPEQTKLTQTVEFKDVGPCKKHIKVTDQVARVANLFYAAGFPPRADRSERALVPEPTTPRAGKRHVRLHRRHGSVSQKSTATLEQEK